MAATGADNRSAGIGSGDISPLSREPTSEHSLVVFEYSGLADPPDDQFGSAQDTSGSNDSITVTAAGANSQAVELNVVGAMSWNPETDITWGGYTEAVDEHNGGYMNYGAATKRGLLIIGAKGEGCTSSNDGTSADSPTSRGWIGPDGSGLGAESMA